LLLTGIAFALLITGFISFGRIVLSEPAKFDFVDLSFALIERELAYTKAEILDEFC
jgi:hypothetical protein